MAWLLSRDLSDGVVARAGSNCRWPMFVLFNEAFSAATVVCVDLASALLHGHPLAAMPASHLAASANPGAVAGRRCSPAIRLQGGGPGRTPLRRFLSPSAFTGRVALSGAAGIRTIPLRRCGAFHLGLDRNAPGGHSGGRSPLRSFASWPTRRSSADRPQRWPDFLDRLRCRPRLRQVMHRLSVLHGLEAMFRYLCWQAGHGLAAATVDGDPTPLEARPGDARGVLPFAVLLLPVAFEATCVPTSPRAAW